MSKATIQLAEKEEVLSVQLEDLQKPITTVSKSRLSGLWLIRSNPNALPPQFRAKLYESLFELNDKVSATTTATDIKSVILGLLVGLLTTNVIAILVDKQLWIKTVPLWILASVLTLGVLVLLFSQSAGVPAAMHDEKLVDELFKGEGWQNVVWFYQNNSLCAFRRDNQKSPRDQLDG